MSRFERYIGIDYSGAKSPTCSLKSLRVFVAERGRAAAEVLPERGSGRYWSRAGLSDWLVKSLAADVPTLVGIDHGFSFPLAYFEKHGLAPNWPDFLEDFCHHWPTDKFSVAEVREGRHGSAGKRGGDSRWLRLTERWSPSAKSVFQFDVQGQVANSTHAGLPWIRSLRRQLPDRIHFWPFDGWEAPQGHSLVTEVYPSLWMRRFFRPGMDGDQQAAHSVSAWLQRADRGGSLAPFLAPPLRAEERRVARVEGWILGVV